MTVNPSFPRHDLSEKRIVKIVQYISLAMGLSVPDLYSYNGLPVFFILYSFLICIILICLCVYTIYFKIINFYGYIIITAAVLDTVTVVGTTIANVISVLFAVIFRRRKMVQVVKNLKEIEWTLNEKFDTKCYLEEKGLLIQFGTLEVFVLSYIIFDTIFEIKENELFHYSWSIVMHVNILMLSLLVMQVQLFSTAIRQYFRFINERLFATMQYPLIPKNGISSNSKFGTIKMKFFLKLYDKLCDVIDLVSESFGIQIAVVAFIIIICLIESMNLIMKYALGHEMSNDGWKISLLIADTWNSVIYILFGIMLAISCDQASNEANNTSINCYKILLNFPSSPKSHYENVTKNELMLLAEHLSQRKIKFSAAGLFAVDHTMLYMIFGSIAAYLVIVLQFK